MGQYNDYARSRIAFRPSVYATGLQQIQPYTTVWPQGATYGGLVSDLASYTPLAYLSRKAGELWYGEEQEGAVGGTCKDFEGLLGTVGATVSCAALSDAQAGRPIGTTERYDPSGTGVQAQGLPGIDFPDWAPDFLKDDEELEEERLREEEEEEKKFRRQLTLVGLGMATILGGIFLYQRGEKKKIEAGGGL